MREFIGAIPARISRLPRDKRGFPVPWFVQWIDGQPHFPIMDSEKFARAVNHKLCWCCGQTLGANKCFVIGPMCVVNRVTAEPPNHYDCALFALRNCPFMANPKVVRGLTAADAKAMGTVVAGTMIDRNPGVGCMWITKSYKLEREGAGFLFRIGPAEKVSFWAHGREATLPEVMHSVETGLPILRNAAKGDDEYNRTNDASRQCERQIAAGLALIESAFEEVA